MVSKSAAETTDNPDTIKKKSVRLLQTSRTMYEISKKKDGITRKYHLHFITSSDLKTASKESRMPIYTHFMLFIVIGTVIAYAITLQVVSMLWDGHVARRLGRETVPFCRIADHPSATVMFIGDSTAVGVGARHVSQSIAGRLATDFPHTTIINHAISGSSSNDLIKALSEHSDWRADLLIIHIGGIDLFGLRPLHTIQKNLLSILRKSQAIAPRIVLFTSANLGSLPFFHFPISLLFSWRTKRLRTFILQRAEKGDFSYVDLYYEPKDDPFLRNRKKFFAPDHIHPSSDGYALWYHKLREILSRNGWDADLKKQSLF